VPIAKSNMRSPHFSILSWLVSRWKGSLRFRQTTFLSLVILLIMGIGSAVTLYEQSRIMRKATEDRGVAFSRGLALMGALVVSDKLFRIQEEIDQYSQDPDIMEIDVIDHDNMIVAAKHLERIGTVLADREWLAMRGQTEFLAYGHDARGDPSLMIVEPLVVNEEIPARIRTIFSLAGVRREEWQGVQRMTLVTLALIAAGMIGIQVAQRHIGRVFRGIIGQLQSALSALRSAEPGQSAPVSVHRQGPPVTSVRQIGQGELEHLTEVVTTSTALLKRQSQALRESWGLLQALLDNTTAVIYLKDTDGKYLLINHQYESLFHVSKEQAVGKTDADLFPPELANAFRSNDLKVLEARRPLELEEVALHDGSLRTYLSLKFPLCDVSGQPYAVCGISTDITERKRAEGALQALMVSLEEKVKERTAELEMARDQALMATRHKSEFLANMSHELRTPLNAVIGFSDMLLEKMFGDLNQKQYEYVQDILSSGRHLLALINDILDLSKVESGRIELELSTFNLPMALENTLTLIRERASHNGIQVSIDIDAGVGEYTADERKVKQILLNLLSNAIKFTPEGGHISVGATLREGEVEIAVTDTGIGIAPDDHQRIFAEFYQIRSGMRKPEGTGLGLALAKKFVELHGGRIWVKSQVGQGSTFTFTLPMRVAVEKPSMAAIEPGAAQVGRPVALVVEDDAAASKLLSIYLTEAGFSVELAADGEVGLKRAHDLRPAIITLDILIPKLDGWDFLARLKTDQTIAAIPVVVVSILEERGKGFALGASDYLVKPVDREELIGTVQRVVPAGGPDARGITILAIDDDPLVLELMDAMLTPEGFTVLKAGDGREGLRLARLRRPDLIVLDLLMPEVDGFQVVDELKRDPATAGIQIIILTSKSLTPQDKDKLNGRIVDLKQKGEFSRAHFVAQLRSVLRAKGASWPAS
jgi:PAS domain S-box-containing protein